MFYPSKRGSSGFLPLSKNMYVRLIGDSKLSLGVGVSVHGCVSRVSRLSLCGPVMDWRPVQPASHPMTAGIGSSTPATLKWIKRV